MCFLKRQLSTVLDVHIFWQILLKGDRNENSFNNKYYSGYIAYGVNVYTIRYLTLKLILNLKKID